jgi:hypothetical protein
VVAYTNAGTILTEDFQDTEDLAGVFSGLDPNKRTYDFRTWQYEGMDVQAASGHRDQEYQDKTGGKNGHGAHQSGRGESHGSGDVAISGNPQVDPTLQHPRCDSFIQGESPKEELLGRDVGLHREPAKAWWGPAATPDNDFCFDYLPRLTGNHSTYETVMAQLAGDCKGYFLMGESPAVGSANAKMQRWGMANLEWLVVRDFSLIESATGPGWPGCTKPGSPTRGSTAVIRRTAWAATARSSCCSTSRRSTGCRPTRW